MREEIADGDAIFAVFGELRNERRDRIGEPHFAFFDQHHHRGRRRDDLRERRQIEDRIERHRFGRGLDRALAVGFAKDDGVAAPDDHDSTGELALGDGVGDDGVEAGQTGEVETRIALGSRRRRLRRARHVAGQERREGERDRRGRSRDLPPRCRHFCPGLYWPGPLAFARLMPRSPRSTRPPTRSQPAQRRPARHLYLVAAAVLLVAVTLVWWIRREPEPGALVIISIDTLRADRLPLYGHAQGKTPALDAFARDAVLFQHAYAHAPQTLPSHASIFTGLLPFEHGIRDNLGFTLAADKPTLPALLQQAGYRTGGFVSSYVLRSETGIGRGFEVYNAEFPETGGDRSPGQVQRPGEQTLAAATRWLDTLADPRFFLFFHIYEPHKPYAPPDRFASLDPYDGEVAYSDEIVGKLLQDLKRRNLYDAATIVVLSDHGEGLGDHGELEHGLFIYDESIRVPWIMKLPSNRSAGRKVTSPIQHIDLVPTMLRLANLEPIAGVRGRDLGPALTNSGSIAPQGIYSEALYSRYHFGWSELLSLTDERYRFIKAPREELYDLERDPDERQNIVSERGQAAAAMRSALDGLVAGRAIDAPSAVSAEDRQRLAALGYVGTTSAPSTQPGTSLPDPKDMAPVLRRYREAVELLDAQKFADGADALGSVLKDNPGMTDVWLQYAGVLRKLGRDAEALHAYQQVVRLKPEEPSGLLGAASTLIALGRLDEARQHADLAVNRSPATAHETLAEIALARKDYAEAQRQANLAAQADPQLPLPVYVRGLIEYHQGRYAQAVPLLLQARNDWARRTIQTGDLALLPRRRAREARALPGSRNRLSGGIANLPGQRSRPGGAGTALPGDRQDRPRRAHHRRHVARLTLTSHLRDRGGVVADFRPAPTAPPPSAPPLAQDSARPRDDRIAAWLGAAASGSATTAGSRTRAPTLLPSAG